ncbi:MAG: HDOD domain-containing protein [Candidatus Riflebacteria bacterium]|nr:HDOD domain-containing protein [Candidatus Riflebacteria bacterium]
MSEKAAFQARDHGNGVLEIIGNAPNMNREHPALNALIPLSRKFANVILTLESGSSIDPAALPKLLEASGSTHLRVVTSDPKAFPFPQTGIPEYASVTEAIAGIKGEAIAEQILKKIESIQESNSHSFNMLRKLNQPGADFCKLGEAIAADPITASQLLKSANSSFLMRRNKVETLSGTLSLLGIEGVKKILLFNIFKSMTEQFGVKKEILEHGRATAHLATYLAETVKTPSVLISKIRLAGLLHDIGSMALAFYFPNEYLEVRKLIAEQHIQTVEAELKIFGIEHQRLGRMIAEKWSFPDYLCQVIGNHHSLQNSEFEQMIVPIFCANSFLNQVVEETPWTPYYSRLRIFFKQLVLEDTQTHDEDEDLDEEDVIPPEKRMSIQQVLALLKGEWDKFKKSDLPAI